MTNYFSDVLTAIYILSVWCSAISILGTGIVFCVGLWHEIRGPVNIQQPEPQTGFDLSESDISERLGEVVR